MPENVWGEDNMKYQRLAYFAIAALLAGCGSEENKAPPPPPVAVAPAEPAKILYPSELVGKFANIALGKNPCAMAEKAEAQTDMWPGLDITPEGLASEGLYCTPKKVEGADGKYTVTESCSGDGGEAFDSNPQYEINGKELKATYVKDGKLTTYKYVACKPKVPVACGMDTITIFNGTAGKKQMAVCAFPSKGPITRVEYKYGPKDDAEMTYVAEASNNNRFFVDSEAAGPRASVTYMWFQVGDTYYAIASCIGGMCKSEAASVVVQGDKLIGKNRFSGKGNDTLQLENDVVFTINTSDYKLVSKTDLILQKPFPDSTKHTPAEMFY